MATYFQNKVWDPGGGGGWESWETVDAPDPTGASYPDPHGTGFGGCSFYRVEGTRFEEESPDVPSERVLWEWNETDLTQFTGPDGWGTPPTVTLTVETLPNTVDGAGRKIIKGTLSAGASGGCAWWINDLPTLPDDFIVEHIQGPRSGSGLYQNIVPEVIVGQDKSHIITLARGGPGFQSTHNIILLNGATMDVGGGYKTVGAGLLHNDDAGYPMRHLFSIRDPTPTTDPRVWLKSLSPPVSPGVIFASPPTWVIFGAGSQPWHASWRSGGTIKKIGFIFYRESGLGSTYIAGFRVLAP